MPKAQTTVPTITVLMDTPDLCEISQEGWLRESLLRHDAGLIAGWLSRPASA